MTFGGSGVACVALAQGDGVHSRAIAFRNASFQWLNSWLMDVYGWYNELVFMGVMIYVLIGFIMVYKST